MLYKTTYLNARVVVTLLIIMASGCVSYSVIDPVDDVYISTRDFLHAYERPDPSLPAQGFLLLPDPARTPSEQRRHMAACQAFLKLHDTLSLEIKNSRRGSRVYLGMPTYWLIKGSASSYDGKCDLLVENYDYERAQRIMAQADKHHIRGPALLAWSQSADHEKNEPHSLFFDLSRFSEADMMRAIVVWRGLISRNPDSWEDGLRITVFREEFRNMLQSYGDLILESLKLVSLSSPSAPHD